MLKIIPQNVLEQLSAEKLWDDWISELERNVYEIYLVGLADLKKPIVSWMQRIQKYLLLLNL